MSRTTLQELCRQAVLSDLGKLDDIPYELANTVANVYYRFFAAVKASDEPFKSIEQSSSATAELRRATVDFEFAPKMVQELRRIRSRGAHSSVVNAAAEFFLSQLKYRIKDAPEKSLVMLKVERFLHRHKVNEIAGFVDVLELR